MLGTCRLPKNRLDRVQSRDSNFNGDQISLRLVTLSPRLLKQRICVALMP